MNLDFLLGLSIFGIPFLAILAFSVKINRNLIKVKEEHYKDECDFDNLTMKLREQIRELKSDYSNQIANLEAQIVNLKALPPPTTSLTIEAQQILHDLTAHGNSIVRITPLSPTDVFWKAPR